MNAEIEDCCSKASQAYSYKFSNDILTLEIHSEEDPQLLKALKAYHGSIKAELRLAAITNLLEVLVLFEHEPALWSTLIEHGFPRLLTEVRDEQTRFFKAALKAASVAKGSRASSALVSENLCELLIESMRKMRPELEQECFESFKSLQTRLLSSSTKKSQGSSKSDSVETRKGMTLQMDRSNNRSSKGLSRGSVKETAAQTHLNKQIETLFEQKKHDKAWQVFAEMCNKGE